MDATEILKTPVSTVTRSRKGRAPLRRTPLLKTTNIESVYGMLKSNRPPVSLEEMDEAVAREAVRRARD